MEKSFQNLDLDLAMANAPDTMRNVPQWVVWILENNPSKSKPDKVPYDAKAEGKPIHASSTNRQTWATFEQAVTAYRTGKYSGIGFIMYPPFAGGDLDNCRNPETGELDPWAIQIIKLMETYSEVSPSLTGVRWFCEAELPGQGINRIVDGHKIELYSAGRFLTFTGRVLPGSPSDANERQDEMASTYHWVKQKTEGKKKEPGPDVETATDGPRPNLSDDDILSIISRSKNNDYREKFKRLWSGDCATDFPMDGRLEGDRSAADLSLCRYIAFYATSPEQIYRMIRKSGLYREKWDREDYRNWTISKAIQGLDKHYKGSGKGQTNADEIVANYNLTDLGNAQRFVMQHERDFLYCHKWSKWLAWDGCRYQMDDTAAVYQAATRTIKAIYSEAARCPGDDDRKALARHALRSEAASRIEAMVRLATYDERIAVSPDDLDTDAFLLNVNNGTVDLRSGTLREHRKDDLITKLAPVDFDQHAEMPLIRTWLNEIFKESKELIDFIQRLLGYSLTGDTREQILPICYGSGANGKSTLLGMIQEMLGDYSRSTNTATLMVRKGEGIPNDIAALKGTRFVTAVEMEDGQRFSESLVKQLTGGDVISARFMRGEWFDFKPTFKIWLGVNHKPQIRGTDNGIWRRIRLIPFTVIIPETKQDKTLPDKLRTELPGLLAWAVAGCFEWQLYGLGLPLEVKKATGMYQSEMDMVGQFIAEKCVIAESAAVKSSAIYSVFESWCKENGESVRSNKWLTARLAEKGYEKKPRNDGAWWFGIGLSTENDSDD